MEAPERVLAPWTPVVVERDRAAGGLTACVWGRRYGFGGAALPTQIATGGEELLAAPSRLVGRADGAPLAWKRSEVRLLERDERRAILIGWQSSETLTVSATVTVEYDGVVRFDLVVLPLKGTTAKLEELALEVPLRAPRATLFHYYPGRWGTAENSGAVPEAGIGFPFKPYLWLGWEEGGLGWFAESDEGWRPQDPKRCLEVVRRGEEACLRVHLFDRLEGGSPATLPWTITCGLQATPVKPIPRDFHAWRICHGAVYGIERKPSEDAGPKDTETALDRIARLGVKTLVFHEDWTPIENYWRTDRGAELKELVTACHARGIKLLLSFQLPS